MYEFTLEYLKKALKELDKAIDKLNDNYHGSSILEERNKKQVEYDLLAKKLWGYKFKTEKEVDREYGKLKLLAKEIESLDKKFLKSTDTKRIEKTLDKLYNLKDEKKQLEFLIMEVALRSR